MNERVADYFAAIARRLHAIQNFGDASICETCLGLGSLDESLGGEPTSGWTECPDCGGTGECAPP